VVEEMKRKIFFRKYNPYGSSINRADQISEFLNEMGYESHSVFSIEGIKDSIIVFVKFMDINEVEIAKRNNNIVIYDCVDAMATGERILSFDEAAILDGVIFPTRSLMSLYDGRLKNTICTVIYHHYDPRIVTPENPHREFRLAYIGAPEGLLHADKIPELTVISDFSIQIREAPRYSCHYSVRREGTDEYRFKPNSKLSTAAACKANIILTRDDVHVELLGDDYPYFTDSSLEKVRETVDLAKESFGSDLWDIGLKHMEMVRFRTDIKSIVNDYIILFNNFKGKGHYLQKNYCRSIKINLYSGHSRILHINWKKWPDFKGGHVIHASSLIKELERRGFDQAYVYSGYRDSSDVIKVKKHRRDQENIVFYELVNTGIHFNFPLDEISNEVIESLLIDIISDFNPEIIHVHHMKGFTANCIKKIKEHFDIPVVLTLRDYWYLCPWIDLIDYAGRRCAADDSDMACRECFFKRLNISRDKEEFKEIHKEFEQRRSAWIEVLNLVDRINTVSPFIRRFYIEKGVREDRMEAIHVGLPLERISPGVNMQSRCFNLVFLGTFSRQKGAHLILDFFERNHDPDIHLYVWGSISDREILSRLNNIRDNRIHYMGSYERENLRDILKNMHIGLVPSVYNDPAPQVIFEFLNAKIPVIGSNRGGIPDFVVDGYNGFIFDPDTEGDLDRVIMKIKETPSIIEDLRRNISPQKDIRTYADEIINLYIKADLEQIIDSIPRNAKRIIVIGSKGTFIKKMLADVGKEEIIIYEREKEDVYLSKYFDCIIVDEQTEDLSVLLRKCNRWLSDSGTIIIRINNAQGYRSLYTLMYGKSVKDVNNRCVYLNDLLNTFREAGIEMAGLRTRRSPIYRFMTRGESVELGIGHFTIKTDDEETMDKLLTSEYIIVAKKEGWKAKETLRDMEGAINKGDFMTAKEKIEGYLSLHPADIEMLYRHAALCIKVGEYADAMRSIDRILLFRPDMKQAIHLKEQITERLVHDR